MVRLPRRSPRWIPQLVVLRNGETITVRYEQVHAMLLNEFIKEHKMVQHLKTTVAEQKKQMTLLPLVSR